MIARRSRSVLARARRGLEKPALPVLYRTNFSTTAPQQQAVSHEDAPSDFGPRLPLSLQSIYYQPLRRTPTLGLPVCDLQLRSYSVRNLEFMCDFALRAAYYCNLPAGGPIPLPKKTERWTVPRGHFVHKKSQENYERVTHKRLIQIKDGHPETIELWLAFLRKHQYYGVGMKANIWGFDELGVGKRMGVSLETLKDVPRPKWAHFGSRRNFETAEKVREILASEGYRAQDGEPEQLDAVLKQVTDNAAVQAKIKEILESPKYKALAEEPEEPEDAVPLETIEMAVEEPTGALTEPSSEVLATSTDAVPEVSEVAPEQVEITPEDEVLAKASEPTPGSTSEAEILVDAPLEPAEQLIPEQPPVEVAPEDSVLIQAPVEPVEDAFPQVLSTTPAQAQAPLEAAGQTPLETIAEDTISTQPAEETILEQTPAEIAAEDSNVTQSAVEPTPNQTPVETASEDSVLIQAPVEPVEDAVPEVLSTTPAQAQAPLEAAGQTPLETIAEDTISTQPAEETTLEQTPAEIAAEDSNVTQSAVEPTPNQTSVETAPEGSAPANAPVEPVEQLTPEQTVIDATDSVVTQPPKQPLPEENVKVSPLDEAAEAAEASPGAIETEVKPVDAPEPEAEPVEVKDQVEEVQIMVEDAKTVETTEEEREKKV